MSEQEPMKNPRRVSAGKKGAETKRFKAALRKKELEEIREENQRLRELTERKEPEIISVTKEEPKEPLRTLRDHLPFFLFAITGLGFCFYLMKPKPPVNRKPPEKKEVDPFEF